MAQHDHRLSHSCMHKGRRVARSIKKITELYNLIYFDSKSVGSKVWVVLGMDRLPRVTPFS